MWNKLAFYLHLTGKFLCSEPPNREVSLVPYPNSKHFLPVYCFSRKVILKAIINTIFLCHDTYERCSSLHINWKLLCSEISPMKDALLWTQLESFSALTLHLWKMLFSAHKWKDSVLWHKKIYMLANLTVSFYPPPIKNQIGKFLFTLHLILRIPYTDT
jgi:hypothetical protein